MYQLVQLRKLEFYYDFLDKYFSRQDFELCYMDTDSFSLAMSGEIVKPGMKQAYEAHKKIDLQQINLVREHPTSLSLNWLAQEACALLKTATLFKMRHSMQINIVAKV